jgi:hypothetical protein
LIFSLALFSSKAYLEDKDYFNAFNNFDDGNQLLEKLFGKYTIHSANCYVCMAQIKHKTKYYLDSYNLYLIALDIYITLMGKNHLYTYRIYLNLLYLSFLLNDEFKMQYLEEKLVSLLDQSVRLSFI